MSNRELLDILIDHGPKTYEELFEWTFGNDAALSAALGRVMENGLVRLLDDGKYHSRFG